jgi:tRNA A-37 threonylcarbamoyl transferase component Bud32
MHYQRSLRIRLVNSEVREGIPHSGGHRVRLTFDRENPEMANETPVDASIDPSEPKAVRTSVEATARVRKLMDHWEDQAEKGVYLRAEDLCANDMDIVERVRDQIDSLRAMTRIMSDLSEPAPIDQNMTFDTASSRTVVTPTFSEIDLLAAEGLGLIDNPVVRDRPQEHQRLKIGRYYLEQFIAQGGHGQVWQAFDPELGRRVAIKITRPERMRMLLSQQRYIEQYRLVEEARKIAKFNAPGIVTIFDVGIQDELAYIVCELIDGDDLSKRLKTMKPTFAEAVRLCIEVAEILQVAHTAGLFHRDIKPANILIEKGGRVVISDFGIAATLADLDRESGLIIGTPIYMSPEQAQGRTAEIGPATDIYALGVILYEMLTGQIPFDQAETKALIAAIISQDPPAPSSIDPLIPAPLERVCLKALSKKPENRQKDALEFANGLRYAALISNVKWDTRR